jgi:THO complex subunit 2 N-terminus
MAPARSDENDLGLVTSESLQLHRPNIPEKRFRTRAFYSQSTFNLLREESEGFSKLVSLIGDTARLRERERMILPLIRFCKG